MNGPGDEPAAVAESHSAVVLFVGDRAYKVKKPVDFGFLDFRTLRARRSACRRELQLNRRLAPDVYLDVCDVLDSHGHPCESILVMRRMPASQRLSTLVRDGADVATQLQQVARLLASFHSTADTGPDIEAAGTQPALRQRWTDNLAGAAPFADTVLDHGRLDEIAELALRYVDGRDRLLTRRIHQGSIVDGHGDLQAEDIFCAADGPRILDCLEFDDALRAVDVLDDAAFLAMDLERLGAPQLAARFLDWYREFSGTQAAASLTHHYIAYRAFVRAKVACLRHAQGAPEAAAAAGLLTGITLRHLRAGQVRLVLVGGLPATGKSTLAAALADRLGAVLLRTDRIRREMPGAAALDAHAGYGDGLYDRGRVHDTYREMLSRAGTLAELGEPVVLDATWNDAGERAAARRLAAHTATACTELRCVAPPPVTAARLAARTGGLSDATPEVAARMAETFAPWPEAIDIDTAGPVPDAVEAACRHLTPAPD
jgi:uncharacterized protein